MEKLKIRRWRKHAECFGKVRKLTPFELEGNHILFTVRTSAKYHSERLPRLFHTWLANVNRSNVVIITDDFDPVLQYRTAEAGNLLFSAYLTALSSIGSVLASLVYNVAHQCKYLDFSYFYT